MTVFIRLVIISSLAFFGGCASVEHQETVTKLVKVSPNIIFGPTIDVPFSNTINTNGAKLTVRWGGEVVNTSQVNESLTRLTIAALTLDEKGRPIKVDSNSQEVNHFAVDLNDSFAPSVNLNGHLVTLYGDVGEKKLVSINNQQVSVPSIKVAEIVDWNLFRREQIAQLKRQDPAYYHNVKPNRSSLESLERGFGSRIGSFGRGRSSRR